MGALVLLWGAAAFADSSKCNVGQDVATSTDELAVCLCKIVQTPSPPATPAEDCLPWPARVVEQAQALKAGGCLRFVTADELAELMARNSVCTADAVAERNNGNRQLDKFIKKTKDECLAEAGTAVAWAASCIGCIAFRSDSNGMKHPDEARFGDMRKKWSVWEETIHVAQHTFFRGDPVLPYPAPLAGGGIDGWNIDCAYVMYIEVRAQLALIDQFLVNFVNTVPAPSTPEQVAKNAQAELTVRMIELNLKSWTKRLCAWLDHLPPLSGPPAPPGSPKAKFLEELQACKDEGKHYFISRGMPF